jgi:hypothetical protein
MLEKTMKMLDALISQGETIFSDESTNFPAKITKYAHWHQRCKDLLSSNALAEKAEMFDRIQQNRLGDPKTNFDNAFELKLEFLKTLKEDIANNPDYWKIKLTEKPKELNRRLNPIDLVARICDRFHSVSRQLRNRHNNRPTLEIEDEYDVQDLIHSLLRIYFDDIRPEEWTPSYAGGSARMDFLLKNEKMVIETKKTRKGLNPKELGDQLIIDIQRYKEHPDCKTLFCFIYDPEGRIANPKGIEKDLSRKDDNLEVIVLVDPKV